MEHSLQPFVETGIQRVPKTITCFGVFKRFDRMGILSIKDVTFFVVMLTSICLRHTDGFVLKNISRSDIGDDKFLFENVRDQTGFRQKNATDRTKNTNSEDILELLNKNDSDINEFDLYSILKFNENASFANFNSSDNFTDILSNNDSWKGDENFRKSNRLKDRKKFQKIQVAKEKLKELIENTTDTKVKNDLANILTEFTHFHNESLEELEWENKIDFDKSEGQMPKFENISYYDFWQSTVELPKYDKNVRPFRSIKPVRVQVSIHVIRVHSISESTMDFGLDIYYRENWTDPRLAYDPHEYGADLLDLPATAIEHIWAPDTYFPNAISATTDSPGSVTHRSLIKIYPNGVVSYIRKISLTADCAMDIKLYPFDKQGCKLVICSFSLLKKDLHYEWRSGDPIDFDEKVQLPEFQLLHHKSKNLDVDYYVGTYSTLQLCLIFKRSAGFCIMQIFFPATAVVMSSWVSLWMEEETQFNDVLAVILAIIFLAYAYNSVMPRVSYVKLLDLYLAACFLFVFLSLGKLVILKYFRKKWQQKHTENDKHSAMDAFNKVVLADEETSAIGSSDEESDDPTKKMNMNNNNVNNNNSVQQNNYQKKRRYSRAKAALQRRITLAKLQMEKVKKKEAAEKRFIRYVRIFHVTTQLVLPIGFACFFVFILIVYPNWPRPEQC